MRGKVHCDWFILVLLLSTPMTRKKWKRLDSSDSDSVALMTPIFLFTLGHKRSYNSGSDASENQSLLCNLAKVTTTTKEKKIE